MKVLLHTKLATTLMSVLLLVACAQTSVLPGGQSAAPSKNPIESVAELETKISEGRQNQLHVLSPDWFSKAERFYAKAKKGANEGSEISEILANIAKAQKALESAEETTRVARTMLPGVIESRENAHLAEAANLGDSFTDIEEQFLDLTRAIEDNNIRYTQKNAPQGQGSLYRIGTERYQSGKYRQGPPSDRKN